MRWFSNGILLYGFLTVFAGCTAGQSGEGIWPGPYEWTELFPDEVWNDYPPEDVQTFTGVVLYEATDPLPSYVQRHNQYKLKTDSGTYDIYMGSSDLFQPIIGWEIELRGCIEEISVEGHFFVEIWPVEYRMAGEPPE
jgi:hypothetical protein